MRRRVVVGIALLAALGGAIITFPGACRRTPAPQPVVLRFDVPYDIDEGEPPSRGFPYDALIQNRMTLYDIEHAIRAAATDDHVRGMVLHIDGIRWGWAKIAEVRAALRYFRHHGKPVYASLSGGGEREYLLASAAGRVCSPPTAVLGLNGLAESALFFKGSLDKLGVTPNYSHVGMYKSAIESYTRADFSPPAREQMEEMVDDDYGRLIDTLATARHLSSDSLRTLFDAGPFDAPDARDAGLVDSIMYAAEVDSMARRRGGRRLGVQPFSRYVESLDDLNLGPHIALVVAAGTISEGKSRDGAGDGLVVGSETLIEALHEARTRSSVRAIVLRIDSPGGSGQASDDIWREVSRCSREKPVVVSMGDVAASGGYYIAMGAKDVIAEPGTITGSIGVFAGKFNVSGLLTKLGVSIETVKRGRNSEIYSPFTDFSPEEQESFQRHLDGFYRLFLHRVAVARHMSVAEVDSVAQGRVWTGRAGLEHKLVDDLGGLEEAISLARRRAGIGASEDVSVDVYPRVRRTFFNRMLSGLRDDSDDSQSLASLVPRSARMWITAASFPPGTMLAMLPFQIEIH